MKCKRSSDDRAINHHTLQVMRQQAVEAVREGQSPDDVAKAFGVSRQTIFRWLAAYTDDGENALLAKLIPGRPKKVSPARMQCVADAVIDKTPLQHKFKYGLWTLSSISELIHQQLKAELARSTNSKPDHEESWVHRAEAVVPGVPARPGAGKGMGDGNLSRYS